MAIFCALAASIFPALTVADSSAQSYHFDIADQTLSQALRNFGQIAGQEIIFTEDVVAGTKARSLKGEYTAEAALKELLSGTGLIVRRSPAGALMIRRPNASNSPTSYFASGVSYQDPPDASPAVFRIAQVSPSAEPTPRDSAPSSDSSSSVTLDEVIVTAQKREQSLQDVPMSVTAIGERSIELAGIGNFTEYARMTPGISFTYAGSGGGQFGDRNVFVRGISSANTLSGGQPTAFYIDEAPVPFSDPNLFDINRIEILRGPQGTLYGSGSLGGTVKIVANRPNSSELSAKIDSTLSSTKGGGDNYEVRGMINIPIVEDRIAIRASGSWREDAGYVDNVGQALPCTAPDPSCLTNGGSSFENNRDDVEQLTFRVAMEVRLTDDLTITPSVFGERMDVANRAHYTIGLEDGPSGLLTNVIGPPSREANDFMLYDLRADYEFGRADLTSSTSWFAWDKDNVLSISELIQNVFGLPDDTAVGLATVVDRDILTHETRLASTGENSLDWLVGAFYQREDFTWVNYSEEPLLPFANKVLASSTNETITKQLAAFGEATYHITNQLSVTGGARYFRTEVRSDRFVNASAFGGPVAFAESLGPSVETGITPKAQITLQPAEDLLFYVLASRGFRAGGPTQEPSGIPTCVAELASLGLTPSNAFESDTVWNYEAGAKTAWADGKLTTNLAVYYIDWDNIQQQLQLACGFAYTTNFGTATSKGAELEVKATPLDGVNFGVSVGYIDARLSEDNPTGVGKNGDRTLNVPRWTAAVNGQYTVPVSSSFSAYIRGDYQYVGRAATSFNRVGLPDDNAFRAAYEVASFSTGLTDDRWEFAVFVENAFDERPEFASFVDSFGAQFPQAITIRPRTIGVTVRRSF